MLRAPAAPVYYKGLNASVPSGMDDKRALAHSFFPDEPWLVLPSFGYRPQVGKLEVCSIFGDQNAKHECGLMCALDVTAGTNEPARLLHETNAPVIG